MRAIISVSDKRGIVDFARELTGLGVHIWSTGGTKKALHDANVAVKSVSELTGFPEILGGRVKTLHPAVHGGILARRHESSDMAQLEEHNIGLIELVIVNLYPFAQTIAREGVSIDEALEQIDIGGPTMVRASAKNHPHVLIVVDPNDYPRIAEGLKNDSITPALRRELAAKAFAHTASYDSTIAGYLTEEPMPAQLPLAWDKVQSLRYGENPHQAAGFYRAPNAAANSIAQATQVQGKELSYNNILDADAALQAVQRFSEATVAIIKHTNPCGLASNDDLIEAHRQARAGDPLSAFGGIVAFNRPIDGGIAEAIKKYFYEVIIAPAFSDNALAILGAKENLRLLQVATDAPAAGFEYRSVSGGLLIQASDQLNDDPATWHIVSKRQPEPEQREAMAWAWQACGLVKSNAITFSKGKQLLGMGAGQPSRIDSVMIAARKAGEHAQGSIVASDAFFPKADGVQAAINAGASAIIQPGGSKGDDEVIAAADAADIVMIFTGTRHFKH